jgi:aminoglycoside/choline kinase family phosphotransferase
MAISDATLDLLDALLAKVATDGVQIVQDGSRRVERFKAKDLIALDKYLTDKNANTNLERIEFENPT